MLKLKNILLEIVKTDYAGRSKESGKIVYFKSKENLDAGIKDGHVEKLDKNAKADGNDKPEKKDVNIFDKSDKDTSKDASSKSTVSPDFSYMSSIIASDAVEELLQNIGAHELEVIEAEIKKLDDIVDTDLDSEGEASDEFEKLQYHFPIDTGEEAAEYFKAYGEFAKEYLDNSDLNDMMYDGEQDFYGDGPDDNDSKSGQKSKSNKPTTADAMNDYITSDKTLNDKIKSEIDELFDDDPDGFNTDDFFDATSDMMNDYMEDELGISEDDDEYEDMISELESYVEMKGEELYDAAYKEEFGDEDSGDEPYDNEEDPAGGIDGDYTEHKKVITRLLKRMSPEDASIYMVDNFFTGDDLRDPDAMEYFNDIATGVDKEKSEDGMADASSKSNDYLESIGKDPDDDDEHDELLDLFGDIIEKEGVDIDYGVEMGDDEEDSNEGFPSVASVTEKLTPKQVFEASIKRYTKKLVNPKRGGLGFRTQGHR